MDYINKKLTLDDGKKYIVIEQVELDNNIYLYLANSENEDETTFVEIKNDLIEPIDKDLFTDKIFPLFVEKLSK